VIGPEHGPFGPEFLHRLPPDEFPRGPLSAEFQDFRNNGSGSFEDFSKADRLRVDGERLPAEIPREPEVDHSELREAVRALWRHEIVAEETAKRQGARAKAGQKQPGRPRVRGSKNDFEDLSQLRSESPGQTCEAQFREALRKKGVDKDPSRRRYVLADAWWKKVHGSKNDPSSID
jgi:hypothetical protein